MSVEITTAMVRQFGRGIDLLQQQEESRFGSRVRLETITSAEAAEFDQVDAVEMSDITTRHQDTNLISVPHRKRVVQPVPASVADLIDPADARRVLNDPQNSYVMSFAAASNRKHDNRVIGSLFATATTGKGGSGTTAFDSTNYQIAAGGNGLTLTKMRTAARMLRAAENPKDMNRNVWFIGYTALQLDDLLGDSTITSADYNSVKALVDGEINTFLGFEHFTCELFDTDASSNRRCVAYRKASVLLAYSLQGRASIRVRADKEDAIQVRYENDSGATRMDEKGVVEILCAES